MRQKLPVPTPPAPTHISAPTRITARQWDGTETHAHELCAWIEEHTLRGSAVHEPPRSTVLGLTDDQDRPVTLTHPGRIFFHSGPRHGSMTMLQGDWLIQHPDSTFTTCTDTRFRDGYEPLTPTSLPHSSVTIRPHEYAQNSYRLNHFTGALLLNRDDLLVLQADIRTTVGANHG